MEAEIPFNRSAPVGRELEYVEDALARGQLAGGGHYTQRCQAFLEGALGVPRVLLTPSCTHALEMCSLLLGLGEGDEVIVPSFTFVSTANAFALHGIVPVFCDIRPDTLNLDEGLVEERITPRTKAIVPVHYAGVGCEMAELHALSEKHQVAVVEDNAHGLFGRYRGQLLGTFGSLATLSFHATKNLTCGEGGALIINDPSLVDRAEIIRDKGTDRSRFFRGEVDRYTWVDLGSSFLLGEIPAAFLMAQLEVWEVIQGERRRLWEFFFSHLGDWAQDRGISLPLVPNHCEQAYHLFYLLLPSLEERNTLISHLKAREIHSVFHYHPLHTSAMGRKLGGREGDCPVTEGVSDRLLRLPFYAGMTGDEQNRVVEALLDW